MTKKKPNWKAGQTAAPQTANSGQSAKSGQTGTAKPSSPAESKRAKQRAEDKRLRQLERDQRSAAMGQRAQEAAQTRTKAPLYVGAFALVMVLALALWWWLSPAQHLSVDTLRTPVVAAQSAGRQLYPANTEYAVQEVIKFGYLPEVPVTATADGDLVIGPKAGDEAQMGLSQPVSEMSTADYLATKVPSPSIDGFTSNPLTWDDAMQKFGTATVFIATVQEPQTVTAMAEAVSKHSHADALIVRSASVDALTAAKDAGFATMFAAAAGQPAEPAAQAGADSQPTAEPQPAQGAEATGETPAAADLASAGITMIELPKDADLAGYQQAGLKVWVTGVTDPGELASLSEAGVFGALAPNPFTIQPSAVKTD